MKKFLNIINKEKKIYKFWLKNKLFNPNKNKNNKNFSIIMPPPNITGKLHIGHAYQQTIMDTIIRYKKMLGYNILWITGTDHAGISTQIIVENYLKKKNIKYKKKILIKELWKWKKKYENKINKQIKQIGCSIYWKIKRFTLDKNFSYSVNKSFIKLYKKKLIYQKYKIVNWDKKIKTTISDLEIYKKKKKIKQYFIKYRIINTNLKIIIPIINIKDILSDIAIIINNNNKLINKIKKNKYIINPINNNKIKIIINKNINNKNNINVLNINTINKKNKKFIKKFKLNIINIFNNKGKISKNIKIYNYKLKKIKKIKNEYKYLKKKKIIKILIKKNNLYKIKKIKKNIKYSNKTNTKIIKLIKKQWYIKTKLLSKKAIKYVKKKKIKFIPSKYKNLYYSWMKNIKDWCISRQINWGHKIPIWYNKNNKIYIGYNKKYIIKKYNLNKKIKLKQDKNILDTWFSSSLWSFASLGWPKNNKILKNFHPINLIVSGFDIIFFWISKMIMITLFILKKKKKSIIPFKKVFITGLITDEKGKKMSKSIGNVIDPIDIIKGISIKKLIIKRTKNLVKDNKKQKIINITKRFFPNGIKKYGTDILRLNLISISNNKLKIKFNINKLNESYNYCNKLWNISKFIFFNIKNNFNLININNKKKYYLIDFWILNKFNIFIKKYKKYINNFEFNKISIILKNFLKKKFCNWYIELFKLSLKNKEYNIKTIKTIIFIYKNILKYSHPIIPFTTEYLWKKFNNLSKLKNKSILLDKFPKIKNKYNNKKKLKNFNIIKKIIIFIRKLNYKKIIIYFSKKYKNIINKNKYLLNSNNIKNIFFKKNKKLLNKKKIYKKKYKILKINKKINIIFKIISE